MAKYVPDIKTQRWVIVAPARKGRPDDAKPAKSVCPFCTGNEALTPPEVYRIGGGEKDKPGWKVRVVPNKFPITDIHEVVIHSENDDNDIECLPLEQVSRIVTAYRDRFRAHEDDGQVLIFCNHGFHAGASLHHPHAQLVVVPKQINLDALSREPVTNIIETNTSYITYCPDFSQWPFETWIVPKEEGETFGDTKDNELADFATVLQKAIQRVASVYNDPAWVHTHSGMVDFGYNFYIASGTKWFVRVIPRFIHRAGFELGTGLNVNIVDPIEAAEILKKAQAVCPIPTLAPSAAVPKAT